jgi:hypothetical protein
MLPMDGQAILAALKEETALCEGLASLREEQRHLIDSGEAEKLLEVLARKERAIARIGELESRLKPVKTSWDQRRRDLPPAERVAIGEAFRQIRGLLEDLVGKETSDAEALAARKAGASRELESLGRRRQVQSAYRASAAPGGSQFIDRKDA